MLISEIYKKYDTMPQLQQHQRVVAGVALMIARSLSEDIEEKNLVSAMLLHDMGNIIKFDLTLYPKYLEPLGLRYWSEVKQRYLDTYGFDEHEATIAISYEVNVPSIVLDIIKSVGFTRAPLLVGDVPLSHKIACYADQRVSPFGVMSLQQRITEGRARFLRNKGSISIGDEFEGRVSALMLLESQIFARSFLSPQDITTEIINEKYMPELMDYAVTTL